MTPCDELAQNTLALQLALQPVDAQTDVDSQQTVSDGVVYVSSDCINGEFVNIFCPSEEGGTVDQVMLPHVVDSLLSAFLSMPNVVYVLGKRTELIDILRAHKCRWLHYSPARRISRK